MAKLLIFCFVSIYLTCSVHGHCQEETMYEWPGKVVGISGAANGIGAKIVEVILKQGVKHVAILDIDIRSGIRVQNEMNWRYGDKVKFYYCDVRNDAMMREVFTLVTNDVGYIDVVINDAGSGQEDNYRSLVDTNFGGVVSGTMIALEFMNKQYGGEGGTVINIASFLALVENYVAPIYSGTKAAVMHFSSCIGMEEYYKRTGVRVMSICFGFTETNMLTDARSYDPQVTVEVQKFIGQYRNKTHGIQSAYSAALGVDTMFKCGKSGDVWLSGSDKPAVNITPVHKKWFKLMEPYLQ